DYADACPIETVALEVASSNEPLRQATADVFESWIDGATERFVDAGVDAAKARELAIFLIAALEGAFVLSRAMKSTEAIQIAGERGNLREARGQPRCDGHGRGAVRFGQQHGELVVVEAGDDLRRRHGFGEADGGAAEEPVTHRLAVLFVERAERVQVEHDD